MRESSAPAHRAVGTTFPRYERMPVEDRVEGRPGATTRMRKATRAVAEALFATASGPPAAERLDWVVDEVDDFIGQSGPRARFVYRACLTAVSTLSPFFVGRLPPLRRLPLHRRTAALERFERSPLGLALFGAKTVMCIVYYEHPGAAADIGFDGQCLVEARRKDATPPHPATEGAT